MKFAKSLLRNEVPEWSQWYIDYKSLKKIVKQAAHELHEVNDAAKVSGELATTVNAIDDRITAPFFYAIDRNVEIVDNFYNSKFAEYTRRLRHIEQQRSLVWYQLTRNETEDSDKLEITAMLLELRSQLRNLHWYAEVNKRGFTKILKKFDKKVGTRAKTHYLSSKINILGFSKGQELTDKIDSVSKILQEIAPHMSAIPVTTLPGTDPDFGSSNSSLSSSNTVTSPLEQLKAAVEKNEASTVARIMEVNLLNPKQFTAMVLRAVAVHSDECIVVMVENSSPECIVSVDSINRRNILHKAVISEGRSSQNHTLAHPDLQIDAGVPSKRMIWQRSPHSSEASEATSSFNADAPIVKTFAALLSSVSTKVHGSSMVLAVDHQLRTPVHYAARYGLAATLGQLLALEPACLEFNDSDELTPLDMAVINKHPLTLNEILKYQPRQKPQLLLTAAKLNASLVCKALVENGKYDINYRDPAPLRGETALHTASKYNHIDTAKMLISLGADIEVKEYLFDWTPLFLAAVDGSEAIADALLAVGAKADILDNSGWSAKEHAALRGHLNLAGRLPAPPPSPPVSGNNNPPHSLDKRKASDETVLKTFGHRYLEDPTEKLVLVTLGSRDIRRKSMQPVQLDTVPMSEAGNTQLDTALSLVVSARESSSDPYYVDLPVPELGLATEPIPFFTKDLEKLQLVFDLVPTYSSGSSLPLARGVYTALQTHKLQDLNLSMHYVSIIEASSLRVLGHVNFEVQIITPFEHPANGINVNSTYWRSLITTRVIGHRGLGKNTLAKSSLQLGENTVESFIQAANLGADYVEFDVQLTKDAVPVIYHDFLVGDSGFDIPMHAMTLNQFMNIQRPVRGRKDSVMPNPANGRDDGTVSDSSWLSFASPEGQSESSAEQSANEYGGENMKRRDFLKLKRSRSVHELNSRHINEADHIYDDAYRRMRYTRDFKLKGFKGNVRGLHIQSKFATLEELFKTLPVGLGFNIEFKYPMLDEAEAEEMDGTVIEINKFVDTILKVIFDHKKDRDIILSSFNPDVCVLLSLKQPSIPVLFLTEGGTAPMMDVRASSLQEAIRFARRFNLLGIVSEALPLIMCPRLVRAVKESGLICFTYGTENNVPENVRTQLKAGVDAVIVDSVLAIRKELTDSGHGKDDSLVQEVSHAIEKANLNAEIS